MKKRIKIILPAALIVLLAFAYLARPSSRIMLSVFPPSDLYNNIAEIEIPKEKLNSIINFDLSSQYVGDYLVGTYFENPSPYGTPVGNCGEITLMLNGNAFTRNYSDWRDRFGGPGSDSAGVILGAYTVPDDITRGKDLNGTIKLQVKENCYGKYGPLRFFIRRAGDF